MTQNASTFIKQVTRSSDIRWRLAASAIANIFLISALLGQPFLIGSLISQITSNAYADVRAKIVLLALLTGLAAVTAYAAAWINNSVLQDIRRDSKSLLYASILPSPPLFFQHVNEGWIESAIATASQASRGIVHECLSVLIRALLFILLTTALIFLHYPLHGLVFFTAASIYLFLAYHLARNSAAGIHSAVAATVAASKEASDMLANVDSIQQYDMVMHEEKRILGFLDAEKKIYRMAQSLLDRNDFLQKIYLTSLFIAFIFSVTIIADTRPQDAILFYIIGLLSYSQLDQVGKSLNSLFEQIHKLESVLGKIYFAPKEKHEKITHEIEHQLVEKITLENISFGYNPEKPIFNNFSLSIEPGSRHLICGPSGSGKSTLIRILAGQIRPQSGRVLMNDRDSCALPLTEKIRRLTLIPQNAHLFNRSIHENATYGVENVPYPDLEDLLLALRLDRLKRDGQGQWLDATVDRNGLNLSGGEKQRIQLARAILHARPMLLLDEATSALDRETEAAVLKLLHERLPDAAIVAVSHHPHGELAGYQALVLN